MMARHLLHSGGEGGIGEEEDREVVDGDWHTRVELGPGEERMPAGTEPWQTLGKPFGLPRDLYGCASDWDRNPGGLCD